jgi:hypothetical protein
MKISVESSSVQIPSTGDMQIACHRIATPEVHCQIGIKQGPGQRGSTKQQDTLYARGVRTKCSGNPLYSAVFQA